ncbi:hypothetical protein K438DRAFT_1848114 [Mycena galopus ATCC 62051]|nr:hypothetical protein K438DRAFT_1848114 [Mycena galopus ATCC 62051]
MLMISIVICLRCRLQSVSCLYLCTSVHEPSRIIQVCLCDSRRTRSDIWSIRSTLPPQRFSSSVISSSSFQSLSVHY